MNTAESVRDYFNSLIGDGPDAKFSSAAEMARFLGLKQSTATTLFSFLKGAKTQYAYVMEWLEKLGGNVVLPEQSMDGFVLIPRVKAVAGAGSSFIIDSDVEKMYAFRESFMHYLGMRAKDAVMMFVQGDSMEPTINNRDTILIDLSDRVLKEGYIYVIALGQELMVKRPQRILEGWNICSENKNYSPIPVRGQELESLEVIGRVRWFGRVL